MQHLLGGFFQLGYVTRDLDAACAKYRERYGPVEFLISEPGATDGRPAPTRRIALTYIDDVMTEIIEPHPEQGSIYLDALPDNVGDLCLHHFGFLIESHEEMLKCLDGLGYAVPIHGVIDGFMSYIYADTRAHLGHFSEFIRLDTAGRDFFEGVPRLTTR